VVFVGVRVCVFECSVCVVRALAIVNGEVNGHSGQSDTYRYWEA
jgi:uncharacterized protein YuzB (UPF0349 family)